MWDQNSPEIDTQSRFIQLRGRDNNREQTLMEWIRNPFAFLSLPKFPATSPRIGVQLWLFVHSRFLTFFSPSGTQRIPLRDLFSVFSPSLPLFIREISGLSEDE